MACTQGLDRRGLVGAFVYYSPWVMPGVPRQVEDRESLRSTT